jgi:hypothetical protein
LSLDEEIEDVREHLGTDSNPSVSHSCRVYRNARYAVTPEQVERLSGVESSVCRLVLDDLVRAGFLRLRLEAGVVVRVGKARQETSAFIPVSRREQTPVRTAVSLCVALV